MTLAGLELGPALCVTEGASWGPGGLENNFTFASAAAAGADSVSAGNESLSFGVSVTFWLRPPDGSATHR